MNAKSPASPVPSQENRSWGTLALTLITSLGISALVVFALETGTSRYYGIPVLWLVSCLAFVIQWLAFLPSYLYQTEKYYDLVGSLTYFSVILLSLSLSGNLSIRGGIIGILVMVWTGRLGYFLFLRIRQDGHDKRFDGVRDNFPRFCIGWTLQGLWVVLTLAAALVAITSLHQPRFGILDCLGLLLWILGFTIEAKADAEKRQFRLDPRNKGRFIQTGLWAWSRHPNYFGEILLWVGVAVMASSLFQQWQWLAWISPIFVSLLLTKISGIPLLEAIADQRWSGQPDYESYKTHTPVLWMKRPRKYRD